MSIGSQAEIASFIDSYRAEAFAVLFEKFGTGFQDADYQRRIQLTNDEPTFNVFKVLGVTRSEVRTHSAFLGMLLSPRGAHEQGVLFLDSFLERCSVKISVPMESGQLVQFPKISRPLDPLSWDVKVEDPADLGRFDIILRSPDLLCVIENKIDAPEGEDQLIRYWKDMKREQVEVGYSEIALIFLTLHGTKALTGEGVPYFTLSYRDDIYFWLRKLRKEPSWSPHLRTVIDQYIQIVLEIAGVKMEAEDVVTRYIRRPENLAIILDIEKHIIEMQEECHKAFWELFHKLLELRLSESEHSSDYEISSPILENYHKGWSGCYITPKPDNSGRDVPQLSIRFVQGRNQEGYSLWLGVAGGNVTATHHSENVQKLAKRLEKSGFKTNWWVANKFLKYSVRGDDFLKQMINNRQSFIREMTDSMWLVFTSVHTELEAANVDLRQERK